MRGLMKWKSPQERELLWGWLGPPCSPFLWPIRPETITTLRVRLTFAPAVPLALQILELNQCLFFIRSPSLGYSLIVTESILRQSSEPQIPRPRSFYVFLTS